MSDTLRQLRETAKSLLGSGEVKLVIGWEQGSEPYRSRPLFATTPEQCDRLILGPTCTVDLANYLRKQPGKTAVVVKGCDSRAVAVLLNENQFAREAVYLIGVACEGLVDLEKLRNQGVDVNAVTALEVRAGEVVVTLGAQSRSLPVSDVLRDECLGCLLPTPGLADVVLGDPVPPRDQAYFRAVETELMALPAEERAAWFNQHFDRCIRCYACVRACPMCYCTTCFAVQSKPQYVPRTVGLDENRMFHLGRAMHLAGRCVACGACDRACPVNIPLRALNNKLASETEDLFGLVAGLNAEQKAPLIEFLPGDTEAALDKAD